VQLPLKKNTLRGVISLKQNFSPSCSSTRRKDEKSNWITPVYLSSFSVNQYFWEPKEYLLRFKIIKMMFRENEPSLFPGGNPLSSLQQISTLYLLGRLSARRSNQKFVDQDVIAHVISLAYLCNWIPERIWNIVRSSFSWHFKLVVVVVL
jgi:hypothetical protein